MIRDWILKTALLVDTNSDYPYCVRIMAKRDIPGQFEQLVLAAVLALGEDAYSVSIYKKINELVRPRSIALGAIYVTLDRLERKGYLRSWLSDPTPERGGRSKRRYRLETSGRRALREAVELDRRIVDAVSAAGGVV